LNYTKNNRTHIFILNALYISLIYDTNRRANLLMETESRVVHKS